MKLLLYSAPAALAGAAGAYHSELLPLTFLICFIYFMKTRQLLIPLISIVTSLFFYLHTDLTLHSLQTSISPEESHLSLRLLTPFTGERVKRAVALDGSEKLIITLSEDQQHLLDRLPSYSTCKWEGELTVPSSAENFSAFDYKKYLYYENIHWVFKAHGLSDCISEKKNLYTFLSEIRYNGIEKTKIIFPDNLQGIAAALLFGDRHLMGDEQIRMYQRLGVIHLLAISGMHVGMITFFLWKVLLKAGLTKETIRISLFVILPFYAVMAGAAPPVLRAVGMVLLGLGLQFIFVRIPLLHLLSAVFVIHLFIFPTELVNAGFQLSYAVSFTLALSSGRILTSHNKIIGLLMVTTVAQFGALPIILWHFYELSLSSFFMNLLYVPLYTLIILPAFIFIYLLSFLSIEAAAFAVWLPAMLIAPIDQLSLFISDIRHLVYIAGKPSEMKMITLSSGMILILSLFEKNRFLLSAISLVVMSAYLISSPYFNPEGHITFINVGQGDSILIQLPYNQGNYLIDTGGQVQFGQADNQFSVGEKVVLPYLKSMGISKIDLLILTHHDWDHIGGAEDLLKDLKIGEVWTSAKSADKEEMRKLLEAFAEKRIPVKELTKPVEWQAGDSSFSLITPKDQLKGNNASLVLQAEAGGKKWLFTGDIEQESEVAMTDEFEDIDVLKVAHHGSNSSTTEAFLEIVKPEIAVISAGRNNMYGHPHADVLERLGESKVYLTSTHGAVRYTFTGDGGTFEVAIPYNIEK